MAGRVVLVCGPPCAGKSTHVREHAQPGDVLVCLDELARAAGSPHPHDHTPEHWAAAGRAYQRALDRLQSGWPGPGTAWVIRCAPTASERRHLAHLIHADEVRLLVPPLEVALARATQDGRASRTLGVIGDWYARHQAPARKDVGQRASRPRPCLDCGTLTRGTRCPTCQSPRDQAHWQAQDARRGTTAQRGYGSAHQAKRARWRPVVDAGEASCWRCGEPIAPGQPWDLGHDPADRSRWRGPECLPCNRGRHDTA